MHEIKLRAWEDYPIGTKALAIMGGHWLKTGRGWKWHNGATFPRPGGDAYAVVLPGQSNQSMQATEDRA